jgi:hypothetical protein
LTSFDAQALDDALVGAPDPEIVELEARLRAAQLAADVVALDALIAEDLLFVGPDGRLATKSQDLEAHATDCLPRLRLFASCRNDLGVRPRRLWRRIRHLRNAGAVPQLRCAVHLDTMPAV